jgi:hypothetical protein
MCAMIEKLRMRAWSTSGDGTDARPLPPWPFRTCPKRTPTLGGKWPFSVEAAA